MSSEALERAPIVARDLREWAASMDHAADSERIPRSHEANLLREAAALLAEVARLEQERERPGWCVNERCPWPRCDCLPPHVANALEAAEAALAVARENAAVVLARIEWCWEQTGDDESAGVNRCPACGNTDTQGHDRSCDLAATLAEPE